MKVVNLTLAAALAVSLAGCLEVDQHARADGAGAGQNKAAPQAVLAERTKTQNEYNRVKP